MNEISHDAERLRGIQVVLTHLRTQKRRLNPNRLPDRTQQLLRDQVDCLRREMGLGK